MASLLIVDDSEGVHETLKTLLEPEQLEIASAMTAMEALEMYQGNPFDVVLADVWMKPVNGVTLLKKLRRFDPSVVVIMMTGFDSKEFVLQSYKAGAFDYLEKPFRLDQLKQSLKLAFDARAQGPALIRAALLAKPDTDDEGGASGDGVHELERKLKERDLQIEKLERKLKARGQPAHAAPSGSHATADTDLAHRTAELNAREQEILRRESELAEQLEQLEMMRGPADQDVDDGIAVLPTAAAPSAPGGTDARLADLERRERALQASQEALKEREMFVEQSENMLFDKGQALQETETALEQLRDDLAKRRKAVEALEAGAGSAAAATGGDLSSPEIAEIRAELEQRRQALEESEKSLAERERALKRAEALLRAREQFLRESESILFEAKEGESGHLKE